MARAPTSRRSARPCEYRDLCGDELFTERSEWASAFRSAQPARRRRPKPAERETEDTGHRGRARVCADHHERREDAPTAKSGNAGGYAGRRRTGTAGASRGANPGAANAPAGFAADDLDALPAEHRQLYLMTFAEAPAPAELTRGRVDPPRSRG